MFKYFPSAVDPVRLAHARLNVDRSDVLPSLLEQGNEIVDGHVDVVSELFSVELESSHGAAETDALLQLELDGVLQLLNLGHDLLSFVHGDGELAHLDQHVSEQLVNLLDDDVRTQEHIVLLGPLSDLGLFLIEGLETLDVDKVEASILGLLIVHGATKHANLEGRIDLVGQLDGSVELLVLFEVVLA